jgi:hypothetical protein
LSGTDTRYARECPMIFSRFPVVSIAAVICGSMRKTVDPLTVKLVLAALT